MMVPRPDAASAAPRHRVRALRPSAPARLLALALGALLCALVAGRGLAQEPDRDFVIIVHADNPHDAVEVSKLRKMFLKKSKRWDDGESVVAFDLDKDSPVRESFTRAVHGKSISAIKSYWQRMIFSGRDVPPDELATEQEVIDRVSATRGGLGYVSTSASLGAGVKVITIEE